MSEQPPGSDAADAAQPPRARAIRTLIVAGAGKPPDEELRRLIAADLVPDAVSAEDAINGTYVDDRLFATVPGVRGRLLGRLPYPLAQVLEVLLRGRHYDAVLTWSDLPSVLVGALMSVWPGRPAHVAVLFWPSKPRKARAVRLVARGIDRFVVCAPLQRRFLQERAGIAAERFVDARVAVDTRFWTPSGPGGELICSVGQEMRDYATLIEALAPLEIPCHIAVGANIFGTSSEGWWKDSLREEALPATVTVGPKDFVGLRELYARSRFVVVPLIPSDNDNGITTIVEAFAMGKAVIVTESPGQVGVLETGVNCLRVAPSDPAALRAAILELWNDPDRCERLGAAGRARVVAEHSVEQWSRVLARAVEGAIAQRAARTRRSRLRPRRP